MVHSDSLRISLAFGEQYLPTHSTVRNYQPPKGGAYVMVGEYIIYRENKHQCAMFINNTRKRLHNGAKHLFCVEQIIQKVTIDAHSVDRQAGEKSMDRRIHPDSPQHELYPHLPTGLTHCDRRNLT